MMRPLRALPVVIALMAFSAPLPQVQAADVETLIEVCKGCHGDSELLPSDPKFPIISGQEFYYLYVQLKDFKAGRRRNGIMENIVRELDRPTLKALAEYFSGQEWPQTPFVASEENVRVAKEAVVSAECTQCHLGDFRGNSRVPRLKNQQPDYLAKTMHDMKSGERANAPFMLSLMKTFPDEWIEALARYLAAL